MLIHFTKKRLKFSFRLRNCQMQIPKNIDRKILMTKYSSMFEKILNFFSKPQTPAMRIGRMGENYAVKFLRQQKNMKIVARNAKIGKLETDIIALDGNCLVFVEVKTRSESAQVDGFYAAISRKKMDNLKKFARLYIGSMKNKPKTWRFDAVDIRYDSNEKIVSINHFENIG